jgi:hypothetical protein
MSAHNHTGLVQAVLLAIVFGAATAAAAPAQESRPGPASAAATIPDTPPGRCAAAWFAMVRDGSQPSLEAFEAAWASPKRLGRASMPERVATVKRIRDDLGTFRLKEVLESEPAGIMVLVERDSGAPALTFEFAFDADAPGKLDTILISAGAARPEPLTPDRIKSTVQEAARCLEEIYVFPELAAKMAAALRARLAAGDYGALKSESALARALVRDLRAVNNDLHLRVMVDPEDGAPASRRHHGDGRSSNFGFRKAEILDGNVGYLRFDAFNEGPEAEKTAAAALGFLANVDALVFDMRFNGGGSPAMVRFVTSFLFDEPTHLNDMIDRNGEVVEEFWTLEEVPGRRFRQDLPVYVLTSSRTFSGAEEFTYNLKALGRATIVGERTGGGAHPTRMERLNSRFVMGVPFMRAFNPVTKTNWEQKGVEPDVAVAADAALDKALAAARAAVQAAQDRGRPAR